MHIHCLVPARIGSSRLKQKNLLKLKGETLVRRALKKCSDVDLFDRVVINSDSTLLLKEAEGLDVSTYKRPQSLGGNTATSEDYIYDYFNNVNCDSIVQVHSIAPLLSVDTIKEFVDYFKRAECDSLISTNDEWLEFLYQSKPLNFNYGKKENSQDLEKVTRLNWAISAWKKDSFLEGYNSIEKCGTYSGTVSYFQIPAKESIMIKEEYDYRLVKAIVENDL